MRESIAQRRRRKRGFRVKLYFSFSPYLSAGKLFYLGEEIGIAITDNFLSFVKLK
jgi:hypothetical protein